MATHKIGNLKFNLTKQGLAFRMGDGATRRFGFGGKKQDGKDDYNSYEGYNEAGDDSDYSYEDGGQYEDDRYADDQYADDRYAEEGYDEGYDEEYDDRQYEDGRYEDENGDYSYEDGGYYPEEEQRSGSVLEYIENNDWVVWALLLLLPPLGIYLLWRFRRYESRIRMILSGISGVWFIIALILIFSGAFSGVEDKPNMPNLVLKTISPSVSPAVTSSIEPLVTSSADPSFAPSATPLGGGTGFTGDLDDDTNDNNVDMSQNVYSPQTGLYYHKTATCSKIDSGVQVTLVTLQAALNRNQVECPVCWGDSEVYYARADGEWYHTDPTCQGMKNAVEYTKKAAENEGKTACPVCAGGKEKPKEKKTKSQQFLESITNDKSGMKVWMTKNGEYYHTDKNCTGMKNAFETTLLKALQSGKPGCPKCASGANKMVYCTSGGKSYHLDEHCQKMQGAKRVTLAAAMVLGKTRCTKCVPDDFYEKETPAPSDKPNSPSNSSDGDKLVSSGDGSTAYVYATPNGTYYHTNSTCTDMKNAQKVTLLSMIKEGRKPCPTCCPMANQKVYVVKDGKHYHSYATCCDMKNAKEGTLAEALAYGYKKCSKCWNNNTPNKEPDKTDDGNDGYSGVYVYASENGRHYHSKKNCSNGESDMGKVLLEQAMDDGKTPCSSCASEASQKVYAKKGGKYYHKDKNCQGQSGMSSGTIAQALVKGFKACPVCCKKDDNKKPDKNKFKPGTSGIDVYVTASGKYFHTGKSCSSIDGKTAKVSLEAALNYNRTACPRCASSARKTVYANKNGKYYHYSSSCAGKSASKGDLATALALGFKACPNCVLNEKDDTPKFDPGTSGIKVYAVSGGKHFHTDSTCGSMKNASLITLEKALNYGLTPCSSCASSAAKKCYAVKGSDSYHFDSTCAGRGAVSGIVAEALAKGLKPCSKCVKGNPDKPDNPVLPDPDDGGNDEDDDDRLAPAKTKVYIDLSGKTSGYLYHKSSKCSDAGVNGGTAVTLKYALEQGYSPCKHCKPPKGIEK